MKNAIRTTIDSAGRIVIPKRIRLLASIYPGMQVEVRFEGGAVTIEPAPREVRLEERGELLVAVAVAPGEELPAATVQQSREALRDRTHD